MLLNKITNRVRQLTRSVAAKPLSADERAYISEILPPAQTKLFFALALYEQRHALRVCQTLCAGGFGTDKELLQAALLHDLGKFDPATGRAVPLWGKVANVVLKQFGGKKLLAKLAKPAPHSWRYVFWLQLGHEERGARLALETGSSQRVVALISDSKALEQHCDPAALALKWADDLN